MSSPSFADTKNSIGAQHLSATNKVLNSQWVCELHLICVHQIGGGADESRTPRLSGWPRISAEMCMIGQIEANDLRDPPTQGRANDLGVRNKHRSVEIENHDRMCDQLVKVVGHLKG